MLRNSIGECALRTDLRLMRTRGCDDLIFVRLDLYLLYCCMLCCVLSVLAVVCCCGVLSDFSPYVRNIPPYKICLLFCRMGAETQHAVVFILAINALALLTLAWSMSWLETICAQTLLFYNIPSSILIHVYEPNTTM